MPYHLATPQHAGGARLSAAREPCGAGEIALSLIACNGPDAKNAAPSHKPRRRSDGQRRIGALSA
ncbi:MAG: hypothetical protein CMI63_07825 [Parvularcula sp.]|nr:hypothetical protein [Parvularcula sp.]